MKFNRENIAFRIMCLVIALNILNCSVDTPDAQPENVVEDLTVNDMESIVEVLLEEVVGIDNAIAEHDEPDDDNTGNFSIKKSVDFSCHQSKVKPILAITSTHLDNHYLFQEQYSEQFHPEIVPPPPKA